MSNFLFGLLVGWIVFTATGREAFMIGYYYMDKAGEKISERVREDIPKPALPHSIPPGTNHPESPTR